MRQVMTLSADRMQLMQNSIDADTGKLLDVYAAEAAIIFGCQQAAVTKAMQDAVRLTAFQAGFVYMEPPRPARSARDFADVRFKDLNSRS